MLDGLKAMMLEISGKHEGTYLCNAGNGLNTLMLDGLKAKMLEISGKHGMEIFLIWFCAVCLGLFGRQLEFKILEHLL